MADWDADDFEPDVPATVTVAKVTDKWDGEDEDDDVKDDWEASSEEEDEEKKKEEENKPVKVKKKKTLAQKIAEKEAAAEEARLEALAAEEEDTPEARLAAKMKQQRLAEEGDRELFKDLVGGVENNLAAGAIDNMMPETKAEFDDFGKKVAEKFASLEGSDHFQDFAANFIEILCRDHLQVATLKKVKQSADAFHSAKLKEEKAKGKTAAGKKPEKKATLKMGRGNDHMSVAGGGYDDMDDFM